MKIESHARARQLIIAARVEGIGAAERDWLDNHLVSCPECSSEANALGAAIQSFTGLPIAATPELATRTSLAVRARAEQLRVAREGAAPLWVATVVSSICMIVITPYVWQLFAWLGRLGRIPGGLWQAAFIMWWFLPGTVLAAAAAWRHIAKHDASNWVRASDWGQL